MSLEQDYPISRTQVIVLVGGLVTMAAVGGLLFGGLIPGLKPDYTEPSTILIGGVSYYFTSVRIATPNLFSNSTSPQAFLFHNVTFSLWVSNWGSISGGLVWGNGSEPNGTVYGFVLGQSAQPLVHSGLFLSPDGDFGASWPGGLLGGSSVELLVRV